MTTSNSNSLDLKACAQALEASGDYQVLKRFKPRYQYRSPSPEKVHKVCIIDTETTGLDTATCEIIELGYQIVEFDSQGHFYKVLSTQDYLNEPEGEISKEVTQVTGLTFDDVKGQHIPWDVVEKEMADVELCVAHNAGFDRPILERYHPLFENKVWGCSATQIDWFNLAHVSSRSQEFLCWKVGHFFYEAHRALDDVQALTHLLAQPIGEPAHPAFFYLLNSIRQAKIMVKATGAPFDIKDDLRSRGYRWNVSERVWQKVIPAAEQEKELAWLIENNTPNPTISKLKATDTFSVRAQ